MKKIHIKIQVDVDRGNGNLETQFQGEMDLPDKVFGEDFTYMMRLDEADVFCDGDRIDNRIFENRPMRSASYRFVVPR